jgi:hypothetical protein
VAAQEVEEKVIYPLSGIVRGDIASCRQSVEAFTEAKVRFRLSVGYTLCSEHGVEAAGCRV